jgi:hypothetical protein
MELILRPVDRLPSGRWAIALGEDAMIPPGALPASGEMPINYIRGMVYFVTGVPLYALGGGADEGIVIFADWAAGGEVRMTIGMRGPLLNDVGEYVTLSTPTLGFGPSRDPLERRWKGLLNEEFSKTKGDPRLLAMLNQRPWYEPERLQVLFDGTDYAQLAGALQEAGTVPVAPFRQEWQAKDTLQVQAVFRRPGETAKNQRLIFLAGVLVSLAASFFVWALELRLRVMPDQS